MRVRNTSNVSDTPTSVMITGVGTLPPGGVGDVTPAVAERLRRCMSEDLLILGDDPGWYTHALRKKHEASIPKDYSALLGGTIPEVLSATEGLDAGEVHLLMHEEEQGKNRVTLLRELRARVE